MKKDSVKKQGKAMKSFVELELQGDSCNFYCPVCGAAIYELDKNPTICRHVLFTYLDITGEFAYLSDGIRETAERMEELACDEDINPPEALLQTIESESVLCFSVTTFGMACTLISSTAYIVVDFEPRSEEVEVDLGE